MDDYHYLYFGQRAIHTPLNILKPYEGFFRPVNTFTWTVLYSIFGTHTFYYRIVVILLHGFTSFLAGYLCFLLTGNKKLLILGTVFFCLNPIMLDTVYWVSAFLTSGLVTTFILISVISYFLFLSSTTRKYFYISVLFFLLAAGTHESSLIVPAIIILLHLQMRKFRDLQYLFPYILISVVVIVLLFTITEFRQGQGINLSGIRYLTAKFHLANKGFKIRPYGFDAGSIFKLGRSFIHVMINPVINFYYPAKLKEFLLTGLLTIPLLIIIFKSETRKLAVTGFVFLTIPLVMHSGSYYPIIFSRHTYLPGVGHALLLSGFIYLIYKLLKIKQISIVLLSIFILGYSIHGLYFIRPEKDYPMHKGAYRRHKQIEDIRNIFIEHNQPYILCMDFPFAPNQFKAISSVFFNDKLLRQTGKNLDSLINLDGLNHIVVKFKKNTFSAVWQ